MQSGPDRDAQLGDSRDDPISCANSLGRLIERREEPVPAVSTSRPPNRRSSRRTAAWCAAKRSRQARSPRLAVSSVDPTMSVNRIVATYRSGDRRDRNTLRGSATSIPQVQGRGCPSVRQCNSLEARPVDACHKFGEMKEWKRSFVPTGSPVASRPQCPLRGQQHGLRGLAGSLTAKRSDVRPRGGDPYGCEFPRLATTDESCIWR